MEYEHFKMEGIQALKSLIKKGDFMVKLDLSDAYFGVLIQKSHRKFLRFSSCGKIYEFQALPFGLGVGPRYFTKLLKPVIAFLQRIEVRLIAYLDDMILLNQSRDMLIRDLVSLKWLLENLGFLINAKKSVYVPTQEIQFLGFQINIQSHNKHTPKGDPLYHNKQWMNFDFVPDVNKRQEIATLTLFLMLI